MVRETRYLLVGNLPENVTEEEISEYFKRFSKIQSVKIHTKKENEDYVCATVAFADIKSASKANSTDNSICGKVLTTSYSEGSATGSVVKRTLDAPRPSFSATRPSSYAQRKGPEDGEVYEGRDYYSRGGESGQYQGYTEEYQRGRPRDRFQGRGGFKQFDRGGHHQWTSSQRHFGDVHRSNSSSDRDAFEKPRVPQSPARSLSQTSRKSPKMKRKQSNSTSRSRSGSSDSSSSSSYSDSSSDSSRSRSRSGSRSSNRASRSKLPSSGSQVKSARSRSQGSNASENTETTEGGNFPHGIRITNLPGRSSDTSLRDGLFHEYKKYGKVNAVQISGNGDGRYAIVSFKKSEDARKARIASQDKRFFGATIRVAEHEGIDVDDAEFRPPEAELDEHHPKATRTLFVGNLEKEITMEELKEMFSKYGEILDIDVKRQGAISAYSFIQFTDIRSVVKALRALDGETMGGMKLKLGFGKSMPTNCVWVDNLADTVQENFLFRQFARYGPLSNMVIDRERGKALIFFNNLENAQFALNEMRNRILNGQKIQIDFASRDCQTDFYDKMEKSGQLKPGQRSNWNYQRQQSGGDTQWVERGRGKFPFVRGSRGFVRGGRGQRWMSGRGYSSKDYPDDYRRQRSYDEYSQGGGTPYSEGDFESDLHAYRTQRERQRSCSPDQYSDDVYSESYREYKARYPEYQPGSPGSEPDETYDYKSRDEMYYKERYVAGSREASPEGSYHGRSWSHSPTRNRAKDSERNTPPTPLGGDDTQDFPSQEHSPSDVDNKFSDYKRSGKDDFDITEADIQELRTSKYSSAHRKESLSRSEERYSRKRSYEDSFTRDSLSKEESNVRKLDRQLSHGSHEKMSLSDSKRDLFQKMKKIQSEISGKMLARTPTKEGEAPNSSNSSDSDHASMTGGELSKLQHEKQLLIEKLKQLEETSNSDNELLDLDGNKKSSSKRPRLDPWSGKRLQSELGNVILGPKKDKSYDVSQSYRKQMEALRKMEEISVKEESKNTSKKNDIFSYEDEKEDKFLLQGLISPKDVPTAFVKKRKKTETTEENKNRMYRHKRENEDERMNSDNDENSKNVLRTDSVTSVGSARRLSSGHSSPRTPLPPGHLSHENIEHRLSESEQSSDLANSLFKKGDGSKRRSKDEHSSPVIIPLGEDSLVTDIPDPRVPKQKRDEEYCLPLPKFAEFTPPMKFNSSNSENSGSLSKENSPCFSPPSSGSKNESPQMSPNDTTSDESQTLINPESTYIPEENSNEPTMEVLENQEMEVDKPPVEGDGDEALSDSSDHNEDFSLDERIRKLDEKLNQLPITTQSSKLGTENISSTSIGVNITSSNPPVSIYSKFKIKKRQDSVGVCAEEAEKGDKSSSEIVKTIINRSSIFDLDSKRLEQINEKYSPNMKSVVSNAEDSSNSVTLRTKAEAKEMPLSTLPGSLAGRLGNGGSSFPTLSVNTQPSVPLTLKIDDKPINSLSPSPGKTYLQDQNSQEGVTADMCSYNSDNRIFNMTDRMDLQNNVPTSFSPRFNSLDNGVNKSTITSSTRTLVESVIGAAEKSESVSPADSNVRSDPRLKKDLLCKSADEHLDLSNKKLENTIDNKVRKSPPKSVDISCLKSDLKVDSDIKSDSVSDDIAMVTDNKLLTNEIHQEECNLDVSSVSLGKRKSEFTPKKDKTKSIDNTSASPTNTDKDNSKSDIKSGSESPELKKQKLTSPEKEKSDTNSPTHSDSAKSDKLKKENDKKSKESKKKDKTEGDSVNKDKGFNDKKDKDHDGDKSKSSPKNNEPGDNKSDKSVKLLPDTTKKETPNKLDADKTEKSQTKKESDKKSEHVSSKKEKKTDSSSSSKKSSTAKTESTHKKDNKNSTESKSKDKTKSSHKTKDSKGKDEKSEKDGHVKSHSGKVSKSASTEKTEKVEQTKDIKNNQVKENVTTSDNHDKKDTKDNDSKVIEKSTEVVKEKVEKPVDVTKVEKVPEVSKDKTISEKPKENKHKTKSSDNSKTKDKNTDSAKHKTKTESTEQHKSKSSHDVTKKDKSTDKAKHKDVSKAKTKSASTETAKSKEKSSDSKSQVLDKPVESENKGKSDSKSMEIDSGKSAEKTKSVEDVKPKEKCSQSDNGKQKEKTGGNGNTTKVKEKSEHEKTKVTEHSSTKPKEKTKHSDNGHNKSKTKDEKIKSSTATTSHVDKVKDKSHKDNNKKDEDRSKSDSKKEGVSENKTSSSSKSVSETTTTSEKKEDNGNNHENKSENKSDNKSENKTENKNDGKNDNSSGNTDSMVKNKSDSKKERKKSGEKSSSSKSSGKKSSSDKKSDSRSSSDKKSSLKKDNKKEEKVSPKEDHSKKSAKKQEVEFDWSAWQDEPYVSMYDRVKRKSSEKDKEREMQERKKGFNHFTKSRIKKHSKFSETEESDFSHDSAEETDAFEEEKVAKPSKEVSSIHESGTKRKRCIFDTTTSDDDDDDDSQMFKSFQKSTLNNKEKNKGATGKSNKHSVNDIYSSDSSETDIDFPPISQEKKKTKKAKKTKKPEIHHDSDSEVDRASEKQKKKKSVSNKSKVKSTPKKKQDVKTPPNHSNFDTHESDLYDIDSDMDIFDRIKLKNQKKTAQKTPSKNSKKIFDTTTDDSDNPMLSPSRRASMKKTEIKPLKKSFLSDPNLFDTDSDSSFPDLSAVTPKNCVTKKLNHEFEHKKPTVTVGAGVVAQTIRSEDIGHKNDVENKKKEKTKKKSKKNDVIKSDDSKKTGEDNKGLFEKMENFISQADPKEKDSKEKTMVKHSKKEAKSQNVKDMTYLDEEEINQAEKLVNNMNKLEKPMKHESAKLNKTAKQDHERVNSKSKAKKPDHSFSSETDTDKEAKSHSVSDHEVKSNSDSKKEKEVKKIDDVISQPKISKAKKKKQDHVAVESVNKTLVEVPTKVNEVDIPKKQSNKLEMDDVLLKKQTNKKELDDGYIKKITSKLEMDNGHLKKLTNKKEKDEGYKIGFGFFDDFPMLDNSKFCPDDSSLNKKGKKKKKEKEDDSKVKKDVKEGVKADEKTPKKKERKKKEAFTDMNIKENGPRLEELVGRLARSAQNDVFDFQEEEEDDKPLFAEFFKVKEELAKKAAANKHDKPEGKKSLENRLSSEEKSDDASSESHEETEDGRKANLQDKKKDSTKTEELCKVDPEQETEKIKESIKSGLLSLNSDDGKIEDTSISSMFSPNHVKEACKDEAKNILAFASPKGIDMGKSDDENSKSSLMSPIKNGISPKGKINRDLVVSQAEVVSKPDNHLKTIDGHLKENSVVEKKLDESQVITEETSKAKKSEVIVENLKTKPQVDVEKNDFHLNYDKQNKKDKPKVQDKPEIPEKSREEIMLEAVSSLEKLSENTSVVTPEPDSYPEGELIIDETTAAVETVTEEPELTEQAQNETDLAILSILPLDEKSGEFVEPLPQQPPLVETQPVITPENVVEPEQITLETNSRDEALEENNLVIDTSAPQMVESQKDVVLPVPTPATLPPSTSVPLPVPTPANLPPSTSVPLPVPTPATLPPSTSVPLPVPTPATLPPSTSVPLPVPTPATLPPSTSVPLPVPTPATLPPSTSVPLPVPTPATLPPSTSVSLPVPTPATLPPSTSVPLPVPVPVMPVVEKPVVEKVVEQKEKGPKSRRNQKTKENAKVQNIQKEIDIVPPNGQVVKNPEPLTVQPEHTSVIPNMPQQLFGQIQDPKLLSKQVPEIQKPEPYRKTRKQKANAKANHQVEVPGTFYPPVYNAVDLGIHLPNNLQGGDASEKENEEKIVQPYNVDVEKHEDMDNLRISGDEGGNATDKRSRRGRKAQNYKELNSGVHGRTTSPRSRTSPRSPRAGMSPRQALSPLSSPKSELSSPVVKIERLPFGCNKNIRMDGDLSNDAITEAKQQLAEVIENQPEHLNFASTKKMVEEISKSAPVAPVVNKEATNVFDFDDDNEPELKIDTTPLKATRTKKGRRNTQESKTVNAEVKNTLGSPNHIVSPLEGRWQCKKDSESEKSGNHPLKLTIALAHSTSTSTCTTNSLTSVINSATIIDSTIPSIKGKKDIENLTKVSSVASTMVSSVVTMTTSVTTSAAPTIPKSNVDRIIDDVSKGIFDWTKTSMTAADLNKEQQILANIAGILPKVSEVPSVTPQPMPQSSKKRHAQGRGEQDMMPPPIAMASPPGHEFVPTKSSPGLIQPPVSMSFGTMSHGRTLQMTPLSVASHASTTASPISHVQIGEPPVISYSQVKSTPEMTTTKIKPLDMALNMTSRADMMTTAHSLSTAAVVTTTTTTTIAQQSPGTSVVMSSQRPMVTNSGNTTVLAGRTVTVKPANTEAYLHQMGLLPGSIPSQAPISAHQTMMPRMPEGKQGFPPGFMPNQAFTRPEVQAEHPRPVTTVSSSEKQPPVTSSAPTCVVHPITSTNSKTPIDTKLMHQQMMQSVSSRAQTVPTSSSSQPIPPAHMQPTAAQMMEKDQQLRNMGMHVQPMMHLMGQPTHVMPNHIQHKPEKAGKTRQNQKAEMPQHNDPIQRPPSAHNQKSSSNEQQQRPLSAHDNPALFQEQIRHLVGKGFIPPAGITPQILQMYHHQQQMAAAAKMKEEKGHKVHPPKEMVSPGIAHQPPSMFAASIASQSSNPQIKSPAVAQTAPSPHPVFSQPSTSQARPSSPGVKKINEKFNQNHWPNESPVDARNEAQRSRPTSVEPAPSPKHWGYSSNQQPKPAHQQGMDPHSKTHLEAVRLVEQHKQQEMLKRVQQEKQDRAKLQEIQRQEIQRREEIIRQQAINKSRDVPSTSASTLQQSERDRQTASVPGKPRSSHMPPLSESGPSVIDPRGLHHISDLQRSRGQSAFASPSGEMIQGIPAHLYRDPEFQQRLHAAAALRMPHLLDAHLYPQGYPLGLPHPYLGQVGGLPIDHPHLPDSRPPSQGGSHGMRSPPPRQAHQAVMKSPAMPGQSRQMPDPPPGEGSLLSLLQRYPVMWQGTLALKNDSCAVQMHVISGFNSLVQTALPQQIVEGTCQPLRIAQRMRLEAAQLEGVIKRMQYDNDYCMLLALPCGSDHDDIIYQTRAMSTGFIQYLQQKQAAGIVNVADPGSQQPAYVVHIFPPCEFSHETLGRLGFELLHQVRNLSHLLVIITTVA